MYASYDVLGFSRLSRVVDLIVSSCTDLPPPTVDWALSLSLSRRESADIYLSSLATAVTAVTRAKRFPVPSLGSFYSSSNFFHATAPELLLAPCCTLLHTVTDVDTHICNRWGHVLLSASWDSTECGGESQRETGEIKVLYYLC